MNLAARTSIFFTALIYLAVLAAPASAGSATTSTTTPVPTTTSTTIPPECVEHSDCEDVIEFEDFGMGEVVSEAYSVGGIGPIGIKGTNLTQFAANTNAAAIYDSNCPGGCSGGLTNLGTPNEDFAGPGSLLGFHIIDSEEDEGLPTIELFDDTDTSIVVFAQPAAGGPNSDMPFALPPNAGVVRAQISLFGSAAIDHVHFELNMSEILGSIENWSDDEWQERRGADITARTDMDWLAESRERMPAILADEIARWR